MLERQSGLKVRRLRSDNGSEFVNEAMHTFCRRNGIIHETTIPYTPEQNGIAERAIAVFFEMVRSMLYTAGVSLRYWEEAFTYAVYIRSLSVTTGLHSVVPYEAWTGRKPNISHLRVFGSLGWAHVPKQVHKGKLESQAVKVRMLGWWVDEAKGYRLENLENGKLIASRDVCFFEDDLPSESAVIEVDNSPTSSKDINDLVNNAIAKDSAISPIPEDNSPPSLDISPSNPLKKDTPATDPATDNLTNTLSPPALRRSGYERKIPSRFALTTIDDISTCDNSNIAFIAVAGEPKTYQEAIQSPHSKQWEQAVKFEYAQLQKLGRCLQGG